MTEPIISVSGLRGIVGQSLTPDVAVRYACAFAEGLPPGPMVISRDGRDSGSMLAESIRGGLCAVGRTCISVGVAATPTVGVLVRENRAAGGLQITASHNPLEYNGLKAFSSEGRVIPDAEGRKVVVRYRAGVIPWVGHEQLGDVTRCKDTVSGHWALISKTVNVERIRTASFSVLLDANHGSGSSLGRRVLSELGCRVTVLGGQPDGQFSHTPEPTAENLADVVPRVKQQGANVGFCLDPDADRLAVIDETGRYLGEEYTLALCVDHLLRNRPGPIVTNCSTSRVAEDLANQYGVPFYRSAVGEANVVDAMLANNAVLGGEGNGGVIDPRVGLVRDSFVGMALLLDAMADRKKTIGELADELPRYEICKTKIALAKEKIGVGLDAVEGHFDDAESDRMDGLRLDWPGKWLLVRGSNTEPIVRAIAEAGTIDEAERLCREAASVLASV